MDEWLFISMAKTKADAPKVTKKPAPPASLGKSETAGALDYGAALESSKVRGAVALGAALVLNAAFFAAVQDRAASARTPDGEVIVAEVEIDNVPLYAHAGIEPQASAAL
jgi:hypothetical protein